MMDSGRFYFLSNLSTSSVLKHLGIPPKFRAGTDLPQGIRKYGVLGNM